MTIWMLCTVECPICVYPRLFDLTIYMTLTAYRQVLVVLVAPCVHLDLQKLVGPIYNIILIEM